MMHLLSRLVFFGSGSLLLYGVIAWLSHSFMYGQGHLQRPIVLFLLVYAGIFVIYVFALRDLSQAKQAEPRSLRSVVWVVIGFGVLFRCVLFFSNPIQEDDFYRYLWDGKVVASGLNPYRFAPLLIQEQLAKQAAGAAYKPYVQLAEEDTYIALILSRVNHPNIPTIYPPFTQAIFGLTAWIAPGSLAVLRLVFFAFDLSICGLLLVLLGRLSLNPLLVGVYAWSPLVIKETMNSAHYDVVPTFCLVLALVLMVQGRGVLAHISLAAAVLGKLYPLLLMPVFLARLWKTRGSGPALLGLLTVGAVLLVGYAPFWHIGEALWTGTRTFAEQWQTNSLIFPGIVALVDERWLANALVGVGLGGAAILVSFRSELQDNPQFAWSTGLIMGVLFLLSPVGNPWYFVWLVPFLSLFPLRSWLLLSGLLSLYYLSFHYIYRGQQETFQWVVWLEYLPFYGLLAWEWRHGEYCKRETRKMAEVSSV